MIIYVLNGCMACVAGLMVSFRLGSAQTDIGTTYGMDAITACCLGGTAMGGGKGYMFGTILGVIFLSSLSTGFNLMNVNAYYQQIIKGVVLLVAIAFNARSGNTFKRKRKPNNLRKGVTHNEKVLSALPHSFDASESRCLRL